MLLEEDLPALLGQLSERVSAPDFVAGAHRRHRRRQLGRGASALAVVAVLAAGTTVVAHRSSAPAVLRTATAPTKPTVTPPAVAAGDAYAAVEQGSHDLILISADTGVHTVLHHTAAGDPVPATAVLGPSRRYVYYLTDPGDGRTTTAWRIAIDGGAPQQLPSSAHAGPSGSGGLDISPSGLVASSDDTEYAYPDFEEPQGVYIQQVAGGSPEHTLDTPPDTARATPVGWLDDDRLVQLGVGSKAGSAGFVFVGNHQGGGQVIDSQPKVKGTKVKGALCENDSQAALLADGRVAYGSTCSPAGVPTLRVVAAPGVLTESSSTPVETTWTAPVELLGYAVIDMTALPDGRLLVRYDNGHCGSQPLPTLIFSPDGTSVPAYGAPASGLHC